ncbi:unnamed protein product [Tuber aestivum]|uniref:Putative zinc-finger domain-containing protein n=1 Tax=Tuber aestivum TaxID=59557 RepID=A0A292Q4N0_9PEZI|nr:unnamed protein product [Tuber aestivum]
MTSYPPTPAFGGFPSVLVNTNRKTSANTSNTTSSPTSPATRSPNYYPKAMSNTPRLPSTAAQIPGIEPTLPGLGKLVERTDKALVEDREEGELSDIEGGGQGAIVNEMSNGAGGRQQAREEQLQIYGTRAPRLDGQAQLYSPNMPSSLWDDPYRPPRPRGNHAHGFKSGHAPQPSAQLSTLPGNELSYCRGWPTDFQYQPIESHEKENLQHKPLPFYEPELSPLTGPQHRPQSHKGPAGVPSHSTMPQASSQLSAEVLLSNSEALRKETETAVSDMLPLKVTFANMVEEGINPRVLRKIFTRLGFPVPAETTSTTLGVDVNVTQAAQQDGRQIATSTPLQRTEIERNAQMIRRQLEMGKSARDKERREAEARAAELVSEREAARAEAEKTKRSAEVEAKKEVLRRKIGELNLPAKILPHAPTPVSSTPVVAAIARASVDVPRIPGLSLGDSSADISNNPLIQLTSQTDEHIDTIMKDLPTPEPKPLPVVSTPAVGLTTPTTVAVLSSATPLERPLNVRKKRPVASDLYSEPQPTKRKFGEQRFGRLIIEVSDDDEGTDEADDDGGDDDDVGHDEARTSRSTPTGTRPPGSIEHVQRSASTVNVSVALRSVNTAPPGTLNAGYKNGSGGTHAKIALQSKMEEIETLKRAIQEAQHKKKLAAKRSVSTPSVDTPNNGSVATPPFDNQSKLTGAEALEIIASGGAHLADKDQQPQLPLTKGKVALKEAGQEKLKLLLRELEELEAAEEVEKRKQAESEIVESKRRAEKQEKKRKLEAFETVKMKSMVARQKLKEEMERIEKEEMEIEEKKLLLEKELETLEQASGSGFTAVEGSTESINEALKRKAAEIENLRKLMERTEEGRQPGRRMSRMNAYALTPAIDDKTDAENSPSGSSPLQSDQALSFSPRSPPHSQEFPSPIQSTGGQHPVASNNSTASVGNRPAAFHKTTSANVSPNEIQASNQQFQQAATLAPTAQSFETRPHEVMDVDDKSALKSSQANDHESDMDIDMDADIEYMDSVHGDVANDDPSSGSSTTSSSSENISSNEEIIAGPQVQNKPVKDNKASPEVVRTVVTGQSLKSPQDEAAIKNTSGEANVSRIVPEQKYHRVSDEVVASSKICTHVKPPNDVFTEYVSPLSIFKSFRYHPRYLEMVPGGYKSLTYTNRIQPLKQMCMFEFNGGVCNDRACSNQHFRELEVSDADILVELASAKEGKTEAEQALYNQGLREEIEKLKAQGIKDFMTVIAGIVAYRRKFLGDESRVLKLP